MSAHETLQPRSVLITGASTGIGAACAVELDRMGWQVFAGVRSEEAGARLREIGSERITPVLIDVTEEDSIQAAAETISSATEGRGLDGLVNNAGIAVPGPLETVPMDKLRLQLEVNVLGQIAVTKAMLPLLREGRGRIVNLSSISGRISVPLLGAYAISKFALEAASDALRLELRRWGIRVSIIEPGPIQTPIWEKTRSNAEEHKPQIPQEQLDLYEAEIKGMEKATQQSVESALPVSRVVEKVVHALTAKRPKTRYPIGWDTRISILLSKLVPDSMRDAYILKKLNFPRS